LSKKDKKKKEMEDLNALLAEMGMCIERFIINPLGMAPAEEKSSKNSKKKKKKNKKKQQ
jgi:hypothetical protein